MSSGASVPDDPNRRACDQCRLRKIRCDKDLPCSNCRIASRACTSTGAGQRPKEARQRVLISSQYERKIDQIESRLGNIETLLRTLASNSSSPLTNLATSETLKHFDTPHSGDSSNQHTSSTAADNESSDHESEYGGDTGLTTQANFASQFLEKAVERTSLNDIDPKMADALSSLRQLVELNNKRSISHGPRFPLQRPVPPGGVTRLPMPSQHIVTAILKENKNQPLGLCNVICTLAGIDDIHDRIRNVYFPTEDISDAQFVIVNAALYMMFMELMTHDTTGVALKAEYDACNEIVRGNLETTLLHMPLFLSTKVENVQALYFGALYSVDVCRPSVAWQLISTAAQLCQTGGYHRTECLAYDPPALAKIKTKLLWEVYTLDKGLALRLGRASVIQDFDISLPKTYRLHNMEKRGDVADQNVLWLKIADLQGRVYEQFPLALKAGQAELTRRAELLGAECRDMETESRQMRESTADYFKNAKGAKLMELFTRGDELQFLATVCLIYKVIPTPEGSVSRFGELCLDAARRAMVLHKDCIRVFTLGSHVQSVYIHWNLMLTPFAPFFILFCYVIETSSPSDLQLLQDFAATLELSTEASEASQKFAKLCRVMVEVVTLYVEAKSRQSNDQTMRPIGDEFELYLSQLGFMPGVEQHQHQHQQGHQQPMMPADVGVAMAMPGQFQQPPNMHQPPFTDWFSGGMSMMGLVEEDLSGMGMGMGMGVPGNMQGGMNQ